MWDAVRRVLELGATSGLTDRQYRVLLVMADRLNKRTGQLNPAAKRLAIDIGLEPNPANVRNIRRTINQLEARGWLQRVGSSKGGQEPGRRYPSQSYRLRADLTGVSSGHPSGVSADTDRGVTEDRPGVSSGHPNLGSRTEEENLPVGSTNRLASPPQSGDASAGNPSAAGRISDDLLAEVRIYDPGAERQTRPDGSEWVELSDGAALPNARRALMFTRYNPATRHWK
jgi:hypothetical protein